MSSEGWPAGDYNIRPSAAMKIAVEWQYQSVERVTEKKKKLLGQL